MFARVDENMLQTVLLGWNLIACLSLVDLYFGQGSSSNGHHVLLDNVKASITGGPSSVCECSFMLRNL